MHSHPLHPFTGFGTLIPVLCAMALLGATLPALADPHDGWKEREGRGKQKCEEKYNARKGEYKLDCKGDGYKYKYKADRNGYKEEWRGAPPPRWAPPAYAVRGGEPQAVYYGPMETDIGIHQGACNRATVGTLLGGTLGGVAGAQIGKGSGRTAATIAGTLLGMYVGNNIARSLDEADRYCTGQVLEQAPDSRPVVWRNPDTQSDYQVTPTRTFEQQGRYCREYTTQSTIGGQIQSTYGTACRQPDGSWQIVQQPRG